MTTLLDGRPITAKYLGLIHGLDRRRIAQICNKLQIVYCVLGCRNRLFTPADVE